MKGGKSEKGVKGGKRLSEPRAGAPARPRQRHSRAGRAGLNTNAETARGSKGDPQQSPSTLLRIELGANQWGEAGKADNNEEI